MSYRIFVSQARVLLETGVYVFAKEQIIYLGNISDSSKEISKINILQNYEIVSFIQIPGDGNVVDHANVYY